MPDSRYLPDPEEETSEIGDIDYEPVRAVTRDDAEEKCQELAKEWDKDLIDVEPRGGTWWDCIFGTNR